MRDLWAFRVTAAHRDGVMRSVLNSVSRAIELWGRKASLDAVAEWLRESQSTGVEIPEGNTPIKVVDRVCFDFLVPAAR